MSRDDLFRTLRSYGLSLEVTTEIVNNMEKYTISDLLKIIKEKRE